MVNDADLNRHKGVEEASSAHVPFFRVKRSSEKNILGAMEGDV